MNFLFLDSDVPRSASYGVHIGGGGDLNRIKIKVWSFGSSKNIQREIVWTILRNFG